MNVLQAIQFVIKNWNEVTTETISNCWHHTEILPSTELLDDIDETDDPILDEISKSLDALNLPNSMLAEEFLTIPEEDIVYEIPEGDQLITELVEMFKKSANESPDDLDEDDSTEMVTIGTNVALKNLKIVNTFLLQQENANECVKLVDTIEKFIRRKQTQTTIHQYFS